MADGYWRIRQYSPGHKTGVTVTTIPLAWADPDPVLSDPRLRGHHPEWEKTNVGLAFRYPDGTEEHYPWTSIVKAEYQPPTNTQ